MTDPDKRNLSFQSHLHQNQIISMFTPFLNVCVNYVEEPFICQSFKILALHFSRVISVKEGMKTGLKLPSRAFVVTAGVTNFVLLSFCQHAANDRDKSAFDEPTASILQT